VLEPKQQVKREVLELVKMVMLFLIMFWTLKTFVIEGYEVLGNSMVPTLEDRERVLVFKLPHQISKLPLFTGMTAAGQGNIIVFDSQDEADKRYIKRVIATGPKRTSRNTVEAEARGDSGGGVKVRFDKGAVFVNNRRIDESYLVPEEGAGHSAETDEAQLHSGEYYVLGDHRSVSKDSRSFGPVRHGQLVGRAVLRFWPLSKFGLL